MFFFTALELFGRLKVYMAETGAQTTVDSVMALGHAMSKNYATLAPRVGVVLPGTNCKSKLAETSEN